MPPSGALRTNEVCLSNGTCNVEHIFYNQTLRVRKRSFLWCPVWGTQDSLGISSRNLQSKFDLGSFASGTKGFKLFKQTKFVRSAPLGGTRFDRTRCEGTEGFLSNVALWQRLKSSIGAPRWEPNDRKRDESSKSLKLPTEVPNLQSKFEDTLVPTLFLLLYSFYREVSLPHGFLNVEGFPLKVYDPHYRAGQSIRPAFFTRIHLLFLFFLYPPA